MLEVALVGLDGARLQDIGGIDVGLGLEGEDVVGSQDHPALTPLTQELRSFIQHPLLDLVVFDLVVDDTVVHLNNKIYDSQVLGRIYAIKICK